MSKLIENVGAITIGILIGFIVMTLASQSIVWHDCYDTHLNQCNHAHGLNKTYSYCSGFLGEPAAEDLNIFCAFHPDEDCREIPHGCVLTENEIMDGLKIPFTNIKWLFMDS